MKKKQYNHQFLDCKINLESDIWTKIGRARNAAGAYLSLAARFLVLMCTHKQP